MILSPRYGRLLGDFEIGATYAHPWEVTVGDGFASLYAASFQDATSTYSSLEAAASLGFRAQPFHPLLCLNLGLSFSVHDVSEQAIAHLAYVDVRFPDALYRGDTVQARSTVIDVKPSQSGDKGVVHVRTLLETTDGRVPCAFERKALIRAGKSDAPPANTRESTKPLSELRAMPSELSSMSEVGDRGFGRYFEEFAPGQVFAHAVGR